MKRNARGEPRAIRANEISLAVVSAAVISAAIATIVSSATLISAWLLRLLLLRWRSAAVLHVVLTSMPVVVLTPLRLLLLLLRRRRGVAILRCLTSGLRILVAILVLPGIVAAPVIASLVSCVRRRVIGVAIVVSALV